MRQERHQNEANTKSESKRMTMDDSLNKIEFYNKHFNTKKNLFCAKHRLLRKKWSTKMFYNKLFYNQLFYDKVFYGQLFYDKVFSVTKTFQDTEHCYKINTGQWLRMFYNQYLSIIKSSIINIVLS